MLTATSLPARLRGLPARLRALDPVKANAAFALVVGVEMQLEAALVPVDGGEQLALHVLLAGTAVAVAARLRFPLWSLAGALGVFVVVHAMGTEQLLVPFFVTILMVLSAAIHTEDRRFALVPAVASVGAGLGVALDPYEGFAHGDLLFPALIIVAGPSAAGRLIRHRSRLHEALRQKAERIERERAQGAQLAALEERTRIASELHDVVAHALSGMTVQAAAARRVAGRDHEAARAAFLEVETTGRQALGELRRLLGVLRREDEDIALAPQPTLAHLPALARRFGAAGLPVELSADEPQQPLPAGLDLTAYRVVQEALAAAREAGAGRARAAVRHLPGAVEIEVTDDGPGRPPGARGLLGVRERLAVVGGDLMTGPTAGGGFCVRARIPVRVEVPA